MLFEIVLGAQTHAFDYDGVGNRETVDGVVYQKNNLNQYTFVGPDNLTYDGNGNLGAFRGDSFTYDEDNRMKTFSRAAGGVSARYSYDGLNRRVKKVVTGGANAGTTYFIYDGDRVIEERNASGGLVVQYIWGPGVDELVEVLRGTDKYFVMSDGLGSTSDIIGTAETVVERFTYDVYGAPDHVSPILPYLFTGQRYDAESGLYYYKARVYSPGLGRFLQRDPVGYLGGLNLFKYVDNNPVNYVDSQGLLGEKEVKETLDKSFGDTLTNEEKDKIAQFTGKQIKPWHLPGLLDPNNIKAQEELQKRVDEALKKANKETQDIFNKLKKMIEDKKKELEEKEKQTCPTK